MTNNDNDISELLEQIRKKTNETIKKGSTSPTNQEIYDKKIAEIVEKHLDSAKKTQDACVEARIEPEPVKEPEATAVESDVAKLPAKPVEAVAAVEPIENVVPVEPTETAEPIGAIDKENAVDEIPADNEENVAKEEDNEQENAVEELSDGDEDELAIPNDASLPEAVGEVLNDAYITYESSVSADHDDDAPVEAHDEKATGDKIISILSAIDETDAAVIDKGLKKEKIATEEAKTAVAAPVTESPSDEKCVAEYKSHKQDKEIREMLGKRCVLDALRGTAELILLISAIVLQRYDSIYNSVVSPGIFIIILLLSAALMWKKLLKGLLSSLKFKPTVHSISAAVFVIGAIYNMATLIIPSLRCTLFASTVVFPIFMSSLAELFRSFAVKNKFDVISSSSVRYSLTRDEQTFEDAYNARQSTLGLPLRHVYRTHGSDFTNGFLNKADHDDEYYWLNYLLFPSFAVGFATMILMASKSGVAQYSAASLISSIISVLPVSLITVRPLYDLISSLRMKKNGYAVLSASAGEEYSKPKLIIFEDTNAFPSGLMKTKGMKIEKGFDTEEIFSVVGSLFSSLGGPVGNMFLSEGFSADARYIADIKRIDDNGIEARIGKMNILAGTFEYCRKYGVSVTPDDRDMSLTDEGLVSVIYIISDRELAARLYVDCRCDMCFKKHADMLARDNDAVAIATCDPSLSQNMADRKLAPDNRVEVLRRRVPGGFAIEESSDDDIIALDRPDAVANAVNECRISHSLTVASTVYGFISFAFNIILCAIMVISQSYIFITRFFPEFITIMWTVFTLIMSLYVSKDKRKAKEVHYK